jgi:hypothetical protein
VIGHLPSFHVAHLFVAYRQGRAGPLAEPNCGTQISRDRHRGQQGALDCRVRFCLGSASSNAERTFFVKEYLPEVEGDLRAPR